MISVHITLFLLGSSRPYPWFILEENGCWNDDDDLPLCQNPGSVPDTPWQIHKSVTVVLRNRCVLETEQVVSSSPGCVGYISHVHRSYAYSSAFGVHWVHMAWYKKKLFSKVAKPVWAKLHGCCNVAGMIRCIVIACSMLIWKMWCVCYS